MKITKHLLTAALLTGLAAGILSARADEKHKDHKDAKPKPYTLKTCPVSDEKLDADPDMKSHSFVHEGREIKLCCKSCLKDFNKDAAKYVKKIETAEKKAAK